MSEEYVETTFDKVIRWIKYDAKLESQLESVVNHEETA